MAKTVLKSKWHRESGRGKNMNVRLKDQEREDMQKKADEFAGGNLSVWMRYAALNMKPRARDLDRVADARARK